MTITFIVSTKTVNTAVYGTRHQGTVQMIDKNGAATTISVGRSFEDEDVAHKAAELWVEARLATIVRQIEMAKVGSA